MIFMDICHDKGVINENHIQSVLSATKRTKYDELKDKFILMDEKFNTELFAANEIDKIKINDEVITSIIEELNDIDFSKLSVHIIGEVYENYLGELAKSRTTDEKKISDKQKKKRKSQGIYYTPDYIVEYIVKNTVGELLAKVKTATEIEKIRVLDPACGSGSFLIRVFDEFLNAYRRVMKVPEGQTMWDEFIIRKKILQNNIFGVDLDAKAVEITKLNLMIKALDRIKPQDLKGNHLLPNLNLNIRCGNSLIGGEKLQNQDNTLNLYGDYKIEIDKLADLKISFYKESDDQKKKDLLAEIGKLEEVINKNINKGLGKYFANLDKIHPFNYTVAFCEIFKAGGFDAVIGNPPYVQLSMEKDINKGLKEFLVTSYQSSMGRLNTFGFFTKLGIDIINNGKYLGFIIPNTILTQDSYVELRQMILDNCKIDKIVSFENLPFKDAVVENIVLVLKREDERIKRNHNKVSILKANESNNIIEDKKIVQDSFMKENELSFNININPQILAIKNKLESNSNKLKEIFHVNQAIALKHDRAKYLSNQMISKQYKQVIDGRNINRYILDWGGEYLKYDLNAIHSCKREDIFLTYEKLFFRRVGSGLVAPYDNNQFYALNTLVVMNLKQKAGYSLKYFLALLNSKLLNFYYRKFLKSSKKVFSEIQARQVEQLPIKIIDFSNKSEKDLHNNLVNLVDEILKLNKTPESREKNKTKIEAVDYELDQLVYKLYGLNKEEINIIENKYEA